MKIDEGTYFTWRLTAYKNPLKGIDRGKMEKRKIVSITGRCASKWAH